MQYFTLRSDGTEIAFSEGYSWDGVHIVIEQEVTDEQKIEIKKQLKRDRDLVSLKFNKKPYYGF